MSNDFMKYRRYFLAALFFFAATIVLFVQVYNGHVTRLPVHYRRNDTRPTLTVEFTGRLGNMMFEIASAIGIAERNSKKFKLLCNNVQQIVAVFPRFASIDCTPNLDNFTHVSLPRWGVFDPRAFELESHGDVVLHGYLQSYKYFQNDTNTVKQLFEFSSAIQSKANKLLPKVSGRVIVGVHVRRGDYANAQAEQFGYVLPAPRYFELAMNFFRFRVKNPLFIVVSEDLTWCRNNIKGPDVEFNTTGSPETDLCFLSMTDHVILSVGTYSWWSGFLNRGTVVYFRDLARNGSTYSKDLDLDDFFPSEWFYSDGFSQTSR